ncbi:MAG TPA: hypothetical protein DCY53_14130 [Desulfobacteraceae bacterium]|nr:hypothetical protein [Desulfobacteraceae bacterium]
MPVVNIFACLGLEKKMNIFQRSLFIELFFSAPTKNAFPIMSKNIPNSLIKKPHTLEVLTPKGLYAKKMIFLNF